MIVSTPDLSRLQGRVTMVSGVFDPLHPGHIEYFRKSAEFGFPVLCNVSNDQDIAHKHAVFLDHSERAEILTSIRYLDYVHMAASSTAEVLEELRPAIFAKGIDWEGKLPPEEDSSCRTLGIEVRFVDAAISSSTAVLARYRDREAQRRNGLSTARGSER